MRRDALPQLNVPDRPWLDDALCRTREYRGLRWTATVLTTAEQRQQVAICRVCPVRAECEADALADPAPWGVRGGLVFRWYAHSAKRLRFTCAVCGCTVVALGAKRKGHVTCSQECNARWNARRMTRHAS